MSGPRVLVVCVLVVLAGCGGLPFGGSDDGTPTLAEVDESTPTTETAATTTSGANTTATPEANTTTTNQTTPAGETGNESETTSEQAGDEQSADEQTGGEAIVGSGANATVEGGNISSDRLVRTHRAYFERADSATRVEWGTLQLEIGNISDAVTVNGTGQPAAGVSIARTNDSTGRLRTQSLLGSEIEQFLGGDAAFVGNATRVAVRGDRSAAAERLRAGGLSNDSAPGSYHNESGAVFDKTAATDGYDYSYNPADSQLANYTGENVTGMFRPTLSATHLTYRGEGSVAGFEGYVYDGNGTEAVDTDALLFAGNVTRFDTTVVVAPAGYIRYVNLTFGVETGTGTASQSLERAIVRVNDTDVVPPPWLDRARANPERTVSDLGTSDTGGLERTNETSDSVTLDNGTATLNVRLERPTVDPRATVEGTVRFQTEPLERLRAGPVARYEYDEDAREVEITLTYTDNQVPGSESNLTAVVWNRDQQRFLPVDARIDTATNTVRLTLTGDAVDAYRNRAVAVLDYERYLAFLNEAT